MALEGLQGQRWDQQCDNTPLPPPTHSNDFDIERMNLLLSKGSPFDE